jgi:C-5 cytosine-specific DNA methylase
VQQTLFDLDSSSGKTSPEFSQRAITPLAASWRALSDAKSPSFSSKDGRTLAWSMDQIGGQRGESWMPNTSAWPNDAAVSSLSQVLLTSRIPPKYFLSGKACAGILRRAAKRGKVLPASLSLALEEVAADQVPVLTERAVDISNQSPCVSTPKAGGAGSLRENPNSGPDGVGVQEGITYTLEARAEVQAVGWCGDATPKATNECMPTMRRDQGGEGYGVSHGMAVRRLTPVECERLQGFPDDFTNIPGAADWPRYRALGNSMAVPVMRWIARRIQAAVRVPHDTR